MARQVVDGTTPDVPLAVVRIVGNYGMSCILDRSITPSSRGLASSDISSARLLLSCSPCLVDSLSRFCQDRRHGFYAVDVTAHHHLPGDAGHLVGQRRGSHFGGLRLRKSVIQSDPHPPRRTCWATAVAPTTGKLRKISSLTRVMTSSRTLPAVE
jgi:hypothetical protein